MIKIFFILTRVFLLADGRDEARMKALDKLQKACPDCTFKILDCDKKGRVYEDEFRRLFGEGQHLPEEIKPRGVYCLTSACEKKVIYAGKKHVGKYIFAVFIAVPHESETKKK